MRSADSGTADCARSPLGRRARLRPEWVFDGIPEEKYRAKGDIGVMLVRLYESLCFDGKWGAEKLSASRIYQSRMRLFRRLGI